MTTTQTLSDRINEAVAANLPGPLRTKALKGIRWVMECPDGYAMLDGLQCALTTDPDRAQVYDGRDNEKMKLAFWSQQLGTPLTVSFLS